MKPPASSSHDRLPVADARSTAHAAATTASTSAMSGLLERATATATGIVAKANPARTPAARPQTRRTVTINSHTASAPQTADGPRTDHDDNPNTLTDAACSQKANGGLSTVTQPPGSNEAKKKFDQLCVIERAAAA